MCKKPPSNFKMAPNNRPPLISLAGRQAKSLNLIENRYLSCGWHSNVVVCLQNCTPGPPSLFIARASSWNVCLWVNISAFVSLPQVFTSALLDLLVCSWRCIWWVSFLSWYLHSLYHPSHSKAWHYLPKPHFPAQSAKTAQDAALWGRGGSSLWLTVQPNQIFVSVRSSCVQNCSQELFN